MKIGSILTAAFIASGAVATTAEADHVQRALILGGEVVPEGSKTYTAGVRMTLDGQSFCGGVLITQSHVLTTAYCVGHMDANYVAVGTHYLSGNSSGENIKVVAVQNHTMSNPVGNVYDFALLTLEHPSKFTPVRLPKADGSEISIGMRSKAMGWGLTTFPNGNRSNELLVVGLEVWDNNDCAQIHKLVGHTSLCAGGVEGYDACVGDEGGPLIIEGKAGDLDDILIGILSWRPGCGSAGSPGVYSRVTEALEWIHNVTKKAVSCPSG